VGLGRVAGEPVELGDGDDRAVPHRGQRLVETGTVVAAGAGESAVDVDPVGVRAEGGQLLDLDLDVLFVGGTAGVADAGTFHAARSV
jgi:hypothetical protein